MKIDFKTLTIQNFMSFGNKPTAIRLDDGAKNLILGDNKDVGEEGYSRNGVGKTSAWQALMWAMFDEVLSNMKKDELINFINKKNMLVTLEFDVDDVPFKIERGRKPSVLSVTKNGEPYTMHSVSTVDECIRELVGMNADVFMNTILLSTSITPFMEMKGAQQRDFMQGMVGLDILQERGDLLKAKNKQVVVDIKIEEERVKNANTAHELTNARLWKLENDSKTFETVKKNNILAHKEDNEALSAIDLIYIQTQHADKFTLTTEKNTLDGVLKEIVSASDSSKKDVDNQYAVEKSKITQQKSSELSDMMSSGKAEQDKLNDEMREISEELTESKVLYSEVKAFLETSVKDLDKLDVRLIKTENEIEVLSGGKCPYCAQSHFDEDKVNSLKENVVNIKQETTDIETERSVVIDNSANLQIEITDKELMVENHKANLRMLKDGLVDFESELDESFVELFDALDSKFSIEKSGLEETLKEDTQEVSDTIAELEDKIGKINPEISESECEEIRLELNTIDVKIKTEEDTVNPYTVMIVTAKEEVKASVVDETHLYELKEREDHTKILVKMLTDNKSFVRRKLLDQYIPYLNTRIAHYNAITGLPHVVELSNDLTVSIKHMSANMSYGNLSKGERGRLNFGTSMAMRDLLSMSGFTFNILIIDELLDNGIDTSGFHAIYKALEGYDAENLFLISHREDLVTSVDNIIHVVKENDFTTIDQ